MATRNEPTYFIDPSLVASRSAETPAADWQGGMNFGASNAMYMGINTGNFGPSEQDFSQNAETFGISQTIGGTTTTLKCIDSDFGDAARVGFLPATSNVAPDALVGDINAVNFFNRTGATIPINEWVWAVADEV